MRPAAELGTPTEPWAETPPPAGRARALCPQIPVTAWNAAPARRAVCWGVARAASARPTARGSRSAWRSAARTAPPTATSVSCAPRAAADTRTCASCTAATAKVRGGAGEGRGHFAGRGQSGGGASRLAPRACTLTAARRGLERAGLSGRVRETEPPGPAPRLPDPDSCQAGLSGAKLQRRGSGGGVHRNGASCPLGPNLQG